MNIKLKPHLHISVIDWPGVTGKELDMMIRSRSHTPVP